MTYQSHGSGKEYCILAPSGHDFDMTIDTTQFKSFGKGNVIETSVRVFHPGRVSLGNECYLGHGTILKGHFGPESHITIGNHVWMEMCYLHGAGGLTIEDRVGIGPNVTIFTSSHDVHGKEQAVMDNPLTYESVYIREGVDIGAGAIILPGVTIEEYAQIGAGAVVTSDVPKEAIVMGNPAQIYTFRGLSRDEFIRTRR